MKEAREGEREIEAITNQRQFCVEEFTEKFGNSEFLIN
jgi:hypothetical protein